MGFFVATGSIFKLLHYPGVGLIRLAMVIPVVMTVLVFVKGRRLTREMSFMIIWLVYAMSECLKLY